MSVSNDGILRDGVVPLDERGLCYIQGRRQTNVGGLQTAPIALIGDLVGNVFPEPLGARFIEVSGGGLDFHTGSATVAGLDYDARITVAGVNATNGGAVVTVTANSLILAGMAGLDVVTAGIVVVPSPAPFMCTYSATAAGGFTLPAATAGQRFTLINLTAGALAVGGAAFVNALDGAALPDIPTLSQYSFSSYSTGVGVYAWRAVVPA